MTEKINAYPLQWPPGWPRTQQREQWRGQVTLPSALADLQKEARLLGITSLVLSSNVTLGSERPADPGVVAYGFYDKAQVAIPCDRWATVAGNVRAIAKTIEAMRGMERWGAKQMIRAMFQGFTALPGATAGQRDWRTVLGHDPASRPLQSREAIMARYRDLAAVRHPDKPGGSTEAMAELNVAKEQALKEIGR